ncbi:MAG: HAMP domain-containing protein [Victivallales bacterium]|nr:HAMP domain-containing protein [Victivallales bacterium]
MPGKSIRFQFAVIGILYVFFALMLILEMFFVYRRAQTDINEMRQTHTTINEYLKLEDEELNLTYRIRNFIANPVNKNNISELDKLDEDIGKWYARIEFWKQKMATWQISEDSGSLENSVFSKTFMFNKKRQANAYKRAVQCCRENQPAEAQHIMNIESRFSHSVHDTILMINSKMELRQEKSIKTLRNFFLIMTVGCLFALALIIISGTGIYRNIISSINKIDLATKRISSGNFTSSVKIANPQEFSFLANSFNNMQNTIKLRDGKIHEDAEDIKKINEFLEQKVISCNRTIEQQEETLSRKNEEMDHTLHMMSEELRQRLVELNKCSEYFYELEENAESSDEKFNSELKVMTKGLKKIQSMSQQLSMLASISAETMHIQHLPMNAVLKNISEHLKFHLGMAGAELDISDNLADCQGDGSMIEQAFVKLVENAIKFRSPERDCKIEISSEVDITMVRYKISDNGLGFDEKFKEKVFQPFFQVNPGNTEGEGLGLAIVHRVMDLHNGSIMVESNPDKGCTFIMELPKQQHQQI